MQALFLGSTEPFSLCFPSSLIRNSFIALNASVANPIPGTNLKLCSLAQPYWFSIE